jgi:hypothetical protein
LSLPSTQFERTGLLGGPFPGYHARVSGFWAVFWLALVLKIPIVALLLIVWWAIRAEPTPEGDASDRGGGSDRHGGPRLRPPRPPRRGPHAEPAPRSPARVRVSARRLAPVHR